MSTMRDAIVPDDKDWTWVLERACPECGADVSGIEREDLALRIRANSAVWAHLLTDDTSSVTMRQHPDRWSTLEYAAHVRDVFRIFRERLVLMLEHDDPLFENWDQDATAIAECYDQQLPSVVSTELVDGATALADAFDGLQLQGADVWQRTSRRSDGASFTIETFGRYLLHDPIHHLWDVQQP